MIAAPRRAYPCSQCGAVRTQHAPGRCWECALDRRLGKGVALIICQNCDAATINRGRGLCSRCYQRLWRTGALPPPNRTAPEEVRGG